jgi:hypothetical protein
MWIQPATNRDFAISTRDVTSKKMFSPAKKVTLNPPQWILVPENFSTVNPLAN